VEVAADRERVVGRMKVESKVRLKGDGEIQWWVFEKGHKSV
jgi:hypothetical protein